MTFLLDTNVLSQYSKNVSDERVQTWLLAVEQSETAISAVSLMELTLGIHLLALGKKRNRHQHWLDEVVRPTYETRILAVTDEIATLAGQINAESRKAGHTPELGDVLLAATARVHRLRIVTLNRKHFELLNANIVSL